MFFTEIKVNELGIAAKNAEYLAHRNTMKSLRLQEDRIEREIATLRGRIAGAERVVADAKQKVFQALGDLSIAPLDLAKLKLEEEEATLAVFSLKREAQSLREAIRLLDGNLKKENDAAIDCIRSLREFCRGEFKKVWSGEQAWKTLSESSLAWRTRVLNELLNRLEYGDPHIVRALEVFLQAKKFSAIIERGFYQGKTADDRRMYSKGDEITVPRDLGYEAAFTEVFNNRLTIAAA